MNEIWLATLMSVVLVSLISFVGMLTLSIRTEKLKKALIYFISFSAGALLGDAFIHLLPEITRENGFGIEVSFSLLGGILVFFVLEKIIHWRHFHTPMENKGHIHPFAYTNLIGDGLHNFIDGLIIAASYLVNVPVGIATTLAVVLHEIPQEIGDFSVLLHAGLSKGKALFLNFLSALTAVLGAVIGLWLSGSIEGITKFLIPLAAGGFIYIAGSDLIPELHKHSDKLGKSVVQFIAFVLGILVMAALLLLE
jgi:zinc and cadmium transporter